MKQRIRIGGAVALALCSVAFTGCSGAGDNQQSTTANASGIDLNGQAEQQIRDAIAGASAHGLKPTLFLKGGESGDALVQAGLKYASALANGYTILLCGPANAISGSLYPDLGFNFLRDITPVAGITREPLVMVVHPSVAAKSVQEFLAVAKANPAANKMASTGVGSSMRTSSRRISRSPSRRTDSMATPQIGVRRTTGDGHKSRRLDRGTHRPNGRLRAAHRRSGDV